MVFGHKTSAPGKEKKRFARNGFPGEPLVFSFPGGPMLSPITIGTGPPGKEKKKYVACPEVFFFSFPGGLVLCPITIGTGPPGKDKKSQGPCFCSVPGCDLLWILAGTAPGKEKKNLWAGM